MILSFTMSRPVVSRSNTIRGLVRFNFITSSIYYYILLIRKGCLDEPSSLFVKEHWHDEHEDVLVFWLLSWYNDTSTARISQVEDNLIAVQITQDFHQAATLETDADAGTAIFASQNFLGRSREVDVF